MSIRRISTSLAKLLPSRGSPSSGDALRDMPLLALRTLAHGACHGARRLGLCGDPSARAAPGAPLPRWGGVCHNRSTSVRQVPASWPLSWPQPPHLSNRSRGSGHYPGHYRPTCRTGPRVLVALEAPMVGQSRQVPGFGRVRATSGSPVPDRPRTCCRAMQEVAYLSDRSPSSGLAGPIGHAPHGKTGAWRGGCPRAPHEPGASSRRDWRRTGTSPTQTVPRSLMEIDRDDAMASYTTLTDTTSP